MSPNIPQFVYIDSRDVTQDVKILEGISGSGTFFETIDKRYNSLKNPINWDNSYKRIIYSTYKHMFYEYINQPDYLFGVERDNDGPDGQFEVRNINDRITVLKLPQPLFGETIVPNTVKINDRSNLSTELNITDDGYSNLIFSTQSIITTGSFVGNNFNNIEEINAEINPEIYLDPQYRKYDPVNERYGYAVSSWDNYLLVGSPMDTNSFCSSKTGKADLLKFDIIEQQYRYIKTFYNIYTQNGFATEESSDGSELFINEFGEFLTENTSSVNDRFGQSVSINESFSAIGSLENCGCNFNDQCGAVFIYDKYKGGADNWGLINLYVGESIGDQFGYSVSITDDWLAVGAPYFSGSGAVYIFKKEIIGQTIPTSSITRTFQNELYSIINCPPTLIDEITDEDLIDELQYTGPSGSINDNSYQFYQRIPSPNNLSNDCFGGSLQLSGSILVVGNCKINPTGDVKLFHLNQLGTGSYYGTGSWDLFQSITGSITQTGNVNFFSSSIVPVTHSLQYFGNAVCLNNNLLFIGSPSDKWYYEYQGATTLYKSGAVYIYQYNLSSSYNFVDKIFANEIDSRTDEFGCSIDSKNNLVAIGALIGDQIISASYVPTSSGTGSFIIQHYQDYAQSIDDINHVNGKAYFYEIQTFLGNYSELIPLQNVKENKLYAAPKRQYGWSVAVSDNGYAFIGDPLFSYQNPTSSAFYDQNILRNNYPYFYSGSVFAYNLNSLTGSINSNILGNVFYKNGIITITATGSNINNTINPAQSRFGFDIEYVSQHTINEYEIICPVEIGEFNVSTNPSSVIRSRILFDVNNDGVFDEKDLDLILRFINKLIQYNSQTLNNSSFEDENGFILEQSEDWWNPSVLITENIDVIYVNSILQSLPSQEDFIIDSEINQSTYDYLIFLFNSGYLDLNGDNTVNSKDMAILINYFYSNFDFKGIRNNIGSLKNATTIITNLNQYTGKNNGIYIDGNFLNYAESASIDKTGSYLAPYVTTVGLYSNYELVAVAKLAKPYKITSEFPINFRITFDF